VHGHKFCLPDDPKKAFFEIQNKLWMLVLTQDQTGRRTGCGPRDVI